MRVIGVDACRTGRVAVILDGSRPPAAVLAAGSADVVAACPDAAAIGADMSLGLAARGWRAADLLAWGGAGAACSWSPPPAGSRAARR